MRKSAFAETHEFAVAPVSADGEIGQVFVALVEEVALSCLCEFWRCEDLAADAHEEAAVVEHVAAGVGPAALRAFPSPG